MEGIYGQKYFITDLGTGFAEKTRDYEKNLTFLRLHYRFEEGYIVVSEDEILSI